MINAKNLRQLVTYVVLLFSSFWIFFCLNESSMVKEGIILFGVLLLANLRVRSIRDVVFPSLLVVFFMVTLLLSGRFFERGDYTMPYKFPIKFIHFLFAAMCASAIYNLSNRQKKLVVLTAFGTLLVSCAVSIYFATFVNPLAIRYRQLAGIAQTISFDQTFALMLIFPALVYFYVKYGRNMMHRRWYLAFAAIVLVCILESALTTVILLTTGGVALCFLMTSFERGDKKAIVIAILLFFALVLFLMFRQQLGELAFSLTKNLNTTVQGRMRRVIDIVFGTEHQNAYTMDDRLELANYSLNTFRAHPLFGVGVAGIRFGVIGYHQEWPDVLGVCGIVGTAVVAAVFMDTFRRLRRRTFDRVDRGAFFLSGALFFILGWLDPCIQLPELYTLMVIVPNMSALLG